MPKRMLDDSLLTSASLAKCSPRAQDAFPRFILLADDFGCFEVIPRALAAKGWVYRQDVTEADTVAWLEEYVGAGMACLWTENERRYCYLTGWDGEHGQRKRVEYDPSAAQGTRPAHGSKRRTPRPPADLVAAVKAGLRRDRDGLPPGVEAFPPGNGVPTTVSRGALADFPPGNAAEGKPSNSTPAREMAGGAREIRGSAASVAVAVVVPDAVAAAVGPPAAAAAPYGDDDSQARRPLRVVEADGSPAQDRPSAYPLVAAYRQALADRLAVPADWLRVASADRVASVRYDLERELGRVGIPAAVEAGFEAACREAKAGKRKPQHLAWYLRIVADLTPQGANPPAGAPPRKVVIGLAEDGYTLVYGEPAKP